MSMSIGQLYGILIGYLVLQDLSTGNWRALIAYSTIPGCLAALACFFILDESARFELLNGNEESSFKILDKMNNENGRINLESLDDQTRNSLLEWTHQQSLMTLKDEKGSIKSLFKGDGKYITPMIWLNWFSSSFIYYGILVMLPYILEKLRPPGQATDGENFNDLMKIFISTSTEIVSVLLSACVIENRKFGRKNSMIIFYGLACLLNCIVFLDKYHMRFVFWVTLGRVFVAMTFIFCFQFTSEYYSTMVRTTGIGMANGIGRLGGMVMPWICFALIEYDLFSPFLAFCALALLSSMLSAALPYDTTGRELDSEVQKGKLEAVEE
jgi:MFS transporter, putative metabolite:H+ symporter